RHAVVIRPPSPLPPPGPGRPTPPLALPDPGSATSRLDAARVEVPRALVERLAATGASVDVDAPTRAEASRDWWPLAIGWALDNAVPALAAAVVRPTEDGQVADVLR